MPHVLIRDRETKTTFLSSFFTGEAVGWKDLPLDILVDGQVFAVLVPWALLSGSTRLPFEADLKWYLEEYTCKQPFSTSRAQDVAKRLANYGRRLASIIVPTQARNRLNGNPVLIRVDDNESAASRINSIHWEVLEDLHLWPESSRPSSVSVVRICNQGLRDLQPTEPDSEWNELSAILNVLALTARPSGVDDVPYRIITRSIHSAVSSLRSAGRTDLNFDIVRPGTFEALKAALESQEHGYYHVVHLDVHGVCDNEDNCSLVFLSSDSLLGSGPPQLVSAQDVARLLTQYGCRQVVLNACRSAQEVGALSSFARVLVQQGLCRVLGMAYNLSESAATMFVSTLYHRLFQPNSNILDSVRFARNTLRSNSDRKSAYGLVSVMADHIIPIVYSRKMHGLQTMLSKETGGFATPRSIGKLEDLHWTNLVSWRIAAQDSVQRLLAIEPAVDTLLKTGVADHSKLEALVLNLVEAASDAIVAHKTLYRSTNLPQRPIEDFRESHTFLADRIETDTRIGGSQLSQTPVGSDFSEKGKDESPLDDRRMFSELESLGNSIRKIAELDLEQPGDCQTAMTSTAILDETVSPLVCDICNRSSQSTFHCDRCNGGDYDVCEECIGVGKHCMDLSHMLSRRTHQDGQLLRLDFDYIPPKQAHDTGIDQYFPGREDDLLELEWLVSDSRFRHIVGSPGVGKTAFVAFARDWWTETGLIDRTVTVDLSDPRFGDWSTIETCLQKQFEQSPDAKLEGPQSLLDSLKRQKWLLIFDNLHDALEPVRSWSEHTRRKFRHLLATMCLTPSLVVVLSCVEVDWLANIGRFQASNVMYLPGLDRKSSIQLAKNLLASYGRFTDHEDVESSRLFEECVSLMEGNPQAIEMLMFDMAQRDMNSKSYYEHITTGGDVFLSADLFERGSPASQTARYAYFHVAEVLADVSHELFDCYDPRYLAPFWGVVPQNLCIYWLLICSALHRGLDSQGMPNPSFTVQQTKQDSETLSSKRARRYLRPGVRSSFLAQDLEATNEVYQVFQLMGLIYEDESHDSTSELGIPSSNTEYFCIHPVLTLILRASYRDRHPNHGTQHAVKAAFFRFMMIWRNPMAVSADVFILPGSTTSSIQWKQRDMDFTNLVTGIHFGLSMEPDPLSLSLLLLRGLSQFLQPLDQVGRQIISRNLKAQATAALANHLRPEDFSAWSNRIAPDIWMSDIEIIICKGAIDELACEPVTWLEALLTSQAVMYSCLALHDCLNLRMKCPQYVLDALASVVTTHTRGIQSLSYNQLEDSVVDMANMTRSLWPMMQGTLQPGSKQAPWNPFPELASRGSKPESTDDINALYGLSSHRKASNPAISYAVLSPIISTKLVVQEEFLTDQLFEPTDAANAINAKVKILVQLVRLASSSQDFGSALKRLDEIDVVENSHPEIYSTWREVLRAGQQRQEQGAMVSREKFSEATSVLERGGRWDRLLNLEIIRDVQQRWHDELQPELFTGAGLPDEWFLAPSR